jgi:diphthamide synthase subunit DPH2
LFYLEQIEKTKDHHRKIANRLTERFDVSAAEIKNELLADGYIKLDKMVRIERNNRNNYFFVLTGKKFAHVEEPEKIKSIVIDEFWPCGTKKSSGNAFDLSKSKGIFSTREIANMANKGKPNNYPVIAYSRA